MAEVQQIEEKYVKEESAPDAGDGRTYRCQGFNETQIQQCKDIVDGVIADPKLAGMFLNIVSISDNPENPGHSFVKLTWEYNSRLTTTDFNTFNSIFNSVFSAPDSWVCDHWNLINQQSKN